MKHSPECGLDSFDSR